MDLFQSDRKRQRISLEDEEESGVSGLMDAGSCIQYRVTGGGGGQAGPGGGGGEGGAGLAAYRVVTSSGDSASDTSNGSINTAPLSNVQAVLASPINGQFYVIGNPSDVLGGVGQRTIAPRAGPFAVDPISAQNNKEDKIGTRRATHNEVERRRRDNINNWIMKLSKLIPDCNNGTPDTSAVASSAGKQSQSKGGILAKACEYLAEMRTTNQRLVDSIKQAEEVSAQNERLSAQVEQLQEENAVLKQQLQNHGILPQTSGPDIKFQL